MADYRPVTASRGLLSGICPNCGRMIYRATALTKLDQIKGGLDISSPTAERRIGDGVTQEPYDPKHATRELTKLVDLDEVIGVSGLGLDEQSRFELLKEVAGARIRAAQTLERFAEGDYRPDKEAEKFPPMPSRGSVASAGRREIGGMEALLVGWEKEKSPRQATRDLWRTYIAEFISFVGHDDPRAIRRQDVIDWKQKLLEDGNSPKTINDSKLAALKAVLEWAVDNGRLPENAAARVSVKRAKKPGEKMIGFDKSDAAVILRAAANETSSVYRWVPLLCAASGARVSEVCQLPAEDVVQVDGVWIMSIRAEAGSVKNVNAERDVPLHPHVVDAGFVDFARRKGSGPLFFDPARRTAGAKKPSPKIVAKNVAAWVHRLDVKVGRTEHRTDPNHGWRHLFKTLGRDVGVEDSVLDAITGNGPPGRCFELGVRGDSVAVEPGLDPTQASAPARPGRSPRKEGFAGRTGQTGLPDKLLVSEVAVVVGRVSVIR